MKYYFSLLDLASCLLIESLFVARYASVLGMSNGSATTLADVKKAIQQADAIGSKNKKGTALFSDMAPTFIKAAVNLRCTAPLLVITGVGAGDRCNYRIFFMQTVIPFFKDSYHILIKR